MSGLGDVGSRQEADQGGVGTGRSDVDAIAPVPDAARRRPGEAEPARGRAQQDQADGRYVVERFGQHVRRRRQVGSSYCSGLPGRSK